MCSYPQYIGRFGRLSLAALAFVPWVPIMAAAAEPLVLVQRIIDTRYGESERAIADFDASR